MSISSYSPFVIGEFKTGVYQYLEPWARAPEAFDPMDNAFVYRGTLQKRNGYTILGRMTYRDNGITLATGDGRITSSPYSITALVAPLRSSSVIINTYDVATSSHVVLTDNGAGGFTGDGTGTINYTTGVVIASFTSIISSPVAITASYTYTPSQLTSPASSANVIVGLKQWTNESTGISALVAFDTRRASVYNNTTEVFDPLSSISQDIYSYTNSTTAPVVITPTISTGWTNVAPFSVVLSDGTVSINDNGVVPTGSFPNVSPFSSATITYATGGITFSYTVQASSSVVISASSNLQDSYFTGGISNFFNATNWQGKLWAVNNVDRITVYDGTDLSRPPFPITQAHKDSYTNDINTCLDLDVFKNRLLVQKPLLVTPTSGSLPEQQSIYWSAINNPTNLVADIAGNGGFLQAPTDDFIQSSEFLRDVLIVLFRNSTWTFRFTGDTNNPFVFQKINNTKSTSAPYGTVAYDERVTSMGNKGLIACDGTNVQRYDIPIIDQFIINISQNKFAQCFAQRFDVLNQTWMLYPSDVVASGGISDKVLVYNFLENTWATFTMNMSCLGLFYVVRDKTWADLPFPWSTQDAAWNSYLNQAFAPTLVGGGRGIVYTLDDSVTDDGATITANILGTQWNPFVGTGERVQFGYIDFYYQINPGTTIDITFYVDDAQDPTTTRTLTLDGPVNNNHEWKRVYINCVGEFLQMEMTSDDQSDFKILGMILWARPSGRLTT